MLNLKNALLWIGIFLSAQSIAQERFHIFPVPNQSVHLFEGKILADQTAEEQKVYSVLASAQKKSIQQQGIVRTNSTYKSKNWKCWEGKKEIDMLWLDDSTFQIPVAIGSKKHYYSFYNGSSLVDKWMSVQLPVVKQKVYIVPLVAVSEQNHFEQSLNRIYKKAGIELETTVLPVYKSKIFNSETIFSTQDSLEMYSGQMRLLRDQFFGQNTQLPSEAYYLFVIPGFSDSSAMGYMLKNKTLGFVPFQASEWKLNVQLARTLAMGMGMLDPAWESSDSLTNHSRNLMDSLGGTQLTYSQVEGLRSELRTFSRFDAYENVLTNNGTIAYYFWKEKQGWIHLVNQNPLESIHRPFRKNFLTSRFQVKYFILKPFYRFGIYYISTFNILFLTGMLTLFIWLRRKIRRIWKKREWRWKILRNTSIFILFLGMVFGIYSSLPWGNAILEKFTVISGPMPELNQMTQTEAKQALFTNPDFHKKRGKSLAAEILIDKAGQWEVKKRLPVLYFDVYVDQNKKAVKMRFLHNSDTLKVQAWEYAKYVTNHYLVFNYIDADKKLLWQKVFSYDGKELSQPDEKQDAPKRILVFVNGYRPTSTAHSLEENFKDIISNGLENKNSTNHIYAFDRYDYWQPWNQINLRFQQRINPTETYYADGHFSVSTSNYGSILNFSRTAQNYPNRCSNPKKHTCYLTKNEGLKKFFIRNSHTENALKMRPNKNGFQFRKDRGRIAGKNLLQILNELPELSKNDTVFIVAHSMGFAYSLGMVEVLRGKVQLGAFYILAPENASAGKVKATEWKEIWQYGSRFNTKHEDAPCMQDGVAPQSSVSGLSSENRLFIPAKSFVQRGFFDSHFIGYYNWILEIPQGEKGAVKQR